MKALHKRWPNHFAWRFVHAAMIEVYGVIQKSPAKRRFAEVLERAKWRDVSDLAFKCVAQQRHCMAIK
jgi:hypothetical protein